MAERVIVAAILKAYKAKGVYAVKIHGEALQPLTVDILACYRGHFIGIEVKDGYGKDATPRQKETLREISRAQGYAMVAHDLEEALVLLKTIDLDLLNG